MQVVLERLNSHVEIKVTDTGQGIRREFLPYVFVRFRQADSSSTREHGGLGLGLAIVRHLTELHGATLAADSPGEGQSATFIVRLPLGVVREGGGSQDQAWASGFYQPAVGDMPLEFAEELAGLRVLVVDDEATVLKRGPQAQPVKDWKF